MEVKRRRPQAAKPLTKARPGRMGGVVGMARTSGDTSANKRVSNAGLPKRVQRRGRPVDKLYSTTTVKEGSLNLQRKPRSRNSSDPT
jgi:hypothetical protein